MPRQKSPLIATGGVYQYVFSKLTQGKLIKQDNWSDWQQAEFEQLNQYWSQYMYLVNQNT